MAIEHLEHTADLGIRAIGATLEEVLCEAARGLFGLMLDVSAVRACQEYAVHIEADSDADLLVEWLADLLAQKELTGLVFSTFDIRIDRRGTVPRLDGVAVGETLDPVRHAPRIEVKGISYLGLDVRPVKDGWIAQCIVDV